MNRKYSGKRIALPKETADKLREIRSQLSSDLGFELSLSEALAHVCKFYVEHKQ